MATAKEPQPRIWIYSQGILTCMRQGSPRLEWDHSLTPNGMVYVKTDKASKCGYNAFWGRTPEQALDKANECTEQRIRRLESDIRELRGTLVKMGPGCTVQKKEPRG